MSDDYQRLRHAVSASNLKSACLYFDRVVPLNPIEFIDYDSVVRRPDYSPFTLFPILETILLEGLMVNRHIIREIMFDSNTVSEKYLDQTIYNLFNMTYDIQRPSRQKYRSAYYNATYVLPMYHKDQQLMLTEVLTDEDTANANVDKGQTVYGAAKRVEAFCSSLNIANPSFLLPEFLNKEVQQGGHEIILSGLNLVDEESLSWEKIIEIRKDEGARNNLRRMRLFMFEKYNKKERSYIEDSILSEIDIYERTCKSYDAKLKRGNISILLSAQSSVAAAAVGVASTLFGASLPWAALTAGATMVGNCLLTIADNKKLKSDYIDRHPLSYILSDAKP